MKTCDTPGHEDRRSVGALVHSNCPHDYESCTDCLELSRAILLNANEEFDRLEIPEEKRYICPMCGTGSSITIRE